MIGEKSQAVENVIVQDHGARGVHRIGNINFELLVGTLAAEFQLEPIAVFVGGDDIG